MKEVSDCCGGEVDGFYICSECGKYCHEKQIDIEDEEQLTFEKRQEEADQADRSYYDQEEVENEEN